MDRSPAQVPAQPSLPLLPARSRHRKLRLHCTPGRQHHRIANRPALLRAGKIQHQPRRRLTRRSRISNHRNHIVEDVIGTRSAVNACVAWIVMFCHRFESEFNPAGAATGSAGIAIPVFSPRISILRNSLHCGHCARYNPQV